MFNTTRLDDILNTGLVAITLVTLLGVSTHGLLSSPTPGDAIQALAQGSARTLLAATTLAVPEADRR